MKAKNRAEYAAKQRRQLPRKEKGWKPDNRFHLPECMQGMDGRIVPSKPFDFVLSPSGLMFPVQQ